MSRNGTILVLVAIFVAFDLFALLRAQPVNNMLEINQDHLHGDVDRRVGRLMSLAQGLAKQPFTEVREHFLFHGRNPGLFMFVVESWVRMGGESPVPLQVFAILLYNIGLFALFSWVRELWRNDVAAIAATAFLAFSPYLLYHSTSIHSDPYDFCFFNLTILCYLRFLRSNGRAWLVAATASYFILCLSYWMFYVSTFVLLLGLHVHENRPLCARSLALMVMPPAAALVLTVLQVIWLYEGFDAGVHRLLDILVARSVDKRIEGSTWFPEKRWVGDEEWGNFFTVVSMRVSQFFFVGIKSYLFLLGAALVLARRGTRRAYRIFLFAIPAAMSWNVMMFQHTVIHKFAGIYGFFGWALVVAAFIAEVWDRARLWFPERRAAAAAVVFAALSPLLAVYWLPQVKVAYWDNIVLYASNVWG